ncbi:MAG TPA: hypothetical protein VK395_36305 [Gemmataceae bacterium]|nr:hypothetical protein [Gemmataceae bacterium]
MERRFSARLEELLDDAIVNPAVQLVGSAMMAKGYGTRSWLERSASESVNRYKIPKASGAKTPLVRLGSGQEGVE